MYFHVSNGPVAAVGNGLLVDLKKRKQRQFAGNMKKAITTRMAGVASLIFLIKKKKILTFHITFFKMFYTYTLTPNNSGQPVMNPIFFIIKQNSK